MPARDPESWMWAQACEFLERAERLHRQFFQPARGEPRGPTWEPPVDILETERELRIVVALPGVAPERVQVVLEAGALTVVGERRVASGAQPGVIRRFEIPYGRFIRRIELPMTRLEIRRQELANGCLELDLIKLGGA